MDSVFKKLAEEEKIRKKFKNKSIKEVIVITDEKSTIEIPMKSGEILIRQGKFLIKFD